MKIKNGSPTSSAQNNLIFGKEFMFGLSQLNKYPKYDATNSEEEIGP